MPSGSRAGTSPSVRAYDDAGDLGADGPGAAHTPPDTRQPVRARSGGASRPPAPPNKQTSKSISFARPVLLLREAGRPSCERSSRTVPALLHAGGALLTADTSTPVDTARDFDAACNAIACIPAAKHYAYWMAASVESPLKKTASSESDLASHTK